MDPEERPSNLASSKATTSTDENRPRTTHPAGKKQISISGWGPKGKKEENEQGMSPIDLTIMQIVSDELSKKADKKDATNRKRPGKKSASRSGEKKTSTEFDKLVVATFKEEKQMSRKTPKAPTKVMTTYYGKVDESELRAIIGTYIKDEFTAIKYSFDGVRASYVLEFDSKRSARTAVNKLKAAQVAGFEVKLLTPEEACEKERKQQIERELHHIDSAIQTLLTTQSGKVKDVQRQIEQITNEKHSDLSVVEEISTLKGKINELKAQETEFLKAANSILAELNVDSKQPTSRILEDSRRRFGLEASKFSSALPMYARRSVIIDCIRANQVSVILAETGSGKSTQVTQYMLEAGLAERGQIVCTQPRKVAAATLARRVAEEMYTTVGHLVGYKAGFVEKRSKRTKIMYVTDHVLLNECIGDPDLSRYSCIVVDEAHERSIYTDLLLGMIKKALQRRPDLHAIITSATIDPEVFVKFFGGCPVLRVPGRVFPVEVFYHNDVTACQPVDNYVALALDKVQYIHEKEPPGDILVFLTSPKETEKACELMEKRISRDKLECLPLHGQQAPSEQQKVFGGVKNGRRKVVFSTNCAETSITIPGIKYVVDTGLAKEKSFDCTKSMSTLKICYISKSSADQRKGRAGRIEPGRCYRLYSESVYDQMKATSTPEILRTHLGLSLLKLMLLGIADPRQFDFVQTPSLDLLETAWQSLKELDAVNSEGLTDLGRQLAQLSLEPKLGKLVIEGIARGIGIEVVMIAALAGVGYNVFFRGKTKDQQEKCDRMKIKLSENRGDIITALGIFDAWNKIPEKKKTSWCMVNSLNGKWLRTTRENVTELLRILNKELHFTVKFNEADVEKVNEHLPSIIAACFSSNICYFSGHRRIGYYPINNVDANFPIHPSSVVSCLRHEADWIVFESILYTSHQFLINITTLSEEEARRVIEERGLAGQRQKAERKRVRRFSVPMIGPSVAKELVRRKYGTIGQMAAELRSALDGSPVAVDYGRDGRLVLFTEAHRRDTLKSFILKEAETYRNDLLLLSHEYEIIEDGDVRCLLKAGGVLQTILMPNQSRTVELFDVSEWKWEELREIFSKFGHIESLIQHRKRGNTQGPSSGKVIYSETKSAVKACKDIDSVEYGFSVRLLVPAKPEETYKVNLSWCRREPRGFAFVSFDDPYSATVVAASALNAMEINGQSVSVLINKKNTSQLYLKNVPRDASQDDLKRAIQSEYSVVVADVSLPREKPYPTSKSDLDMYKRQLRHRLPDDIRCDIHLFNPKESDWFVRGYATCSGMEDANRICESHIVICMNGHTARVQAVIQFEIKEYIPQAIFRAIQSELESVLRQLDGPDSVVKSETLNNGCFRFRVTVSGIDRLRYCTARIDAVTKPLVKVVNEPDQRRLISSPEGRYFLKKLMNRKVKVHASFDQGRSALLVYGSREAVDAAMRQIGDFFTQHKHHHLRRLSLIGEGRVVGVLRALFRKFDIDLEKLRRQCHLDSVEVDILQHELIVYGEQEALERCDAVLQEVINELSAHSQDNGKEGQKGEGAAAAAAGPTEVVEEEEEREDFCPVCFDTPSDDSYTTEYCGHIYCRDCMDGLIHHGIRSRRLPIECAAEKCGARLVIPDFYALLGQHREALQPLIAAALDSFVVEHSDKYSHCLTPDCPVVYKVTSRKHRFDCPNPACRAAICTHCKDKYHEAMSCDMYQGLQSDRDYDVKAWVKQSPEKRAQCPKCGFYIEKNGGCMRVTCKCGAHICWKCKEVFPTATKTYDHLIKCNGAIFGNDLLEGDML